MFQEISNNFIKWFGKGIDNFWFFALKEELV